jgi:hypothetical protein
VTASVLRVRVRRSPTGYRWCVKMIRTTVALGIAKKVYDEARKPQNQARIKSAIARARSRKSGPR